MKMKRIINNILNVFLLVLIISVSSYAWMITQPSRGENVNYKADLVVTSNDLTIKPFVYDEKTMEYYEDNSSPMKVGLVGPGTIQKYKFEITNNKDTPARINIVFSNITGDIDLLKDKVYLGTTNNNSLFELKISDMLEDNPSGGKYIKFIKDLEIPENKTISLYWYVYIDQYASNEICDTELLVDKIMFLKA